jgi:hypothetical protein
MIRPQLNEARFDATLLPYLQKMIHEEYHFLKPVDITGHKKHFYNEGVVDFSYPEIDKISFEVVQDDLNRAREKTATGGVLDAVKSLYEAKYVEQQHIIDLLQAIKNGDDEAFYIASTKLYGLPHPQLYWFTVDQINTRFKSLISKIDAKRTTLHRAFYTWEGYFKTLKKPDRIGVHHLPFYEGIYTPDDYEIDSAEKIASLFTQYLEKRGITGWTVHIDLPGFRTAFSVNQAQKVIDIPHDSDLAMRKDSITKQSLQALLEHEIGVHVVRRERGDQSKLGLLGFGLDNYLRAEEGIATFAEQLITGVTGYSGEIGYLSVGAAVGTLGRPLNFYDLFTLLHAYFVLDIADKKLHEQGFYELDELRMMATDKAWGRTLRTYRGSSGTTTGTVYTRDIIYLEGNRAIWKLVDTEPKVEEDWLVGKYDPTNPAHIQALKALGIL